MLPILAVIPVCEIAGAAIGAVIANALLDD